MLELYFRAVKFVFFPRRDLIYIYKESLPQVDGFHRVLRIPPPIKLTATTDITEILLKVELSIITLTQTINNLVSKRKVVENPMQSDENHTLQLSMCITSALTLYIYLIFNN